MRRSLSLLSVLVVVVIALAAATAASAASIFATGGGAEEFAGNKHYVQFELSAHTGKNGDFGQVRFQINDPTVPLDMRINVDCVNVFPFPLTNGQAWIDGAATRVSPQPNAYGIVPGDRFEFNAVDGGNPSATAPVDQFDAYFEFDPLCKTIPPSFYFPNVTQGNVNISTG